MAMGLGGSYKHLTMELNKGVYMPQPRTTPKLHFQEITCKCHNDRSHYYVMKTWQWSTLRKTILGAIFYFLQIPHHPDRRPGAGGNWVSRRRYNLAVTYIQPRYGIINLSFNEWLNIFHVYINGSFNLAVNTPHHRLLFSEVIIFNQSSFETILKALSKSQNYVAGRTMAGPVISTLKQAFSKSFCWNIISFVYTIKD